MSTYTQKLFGEKARAMLTHMAGEMPRGQWHFENMMNGRGIEISVKQLKNRRSLSQNAMLWAIYDIIANHTGMTSQEVHNAMRGMHLGYRETKLGPVPRSTSNLTTHQFSDYLEQISAFAIEELNLRLPMTPEEFDAWEKDQSA